MVERSADDHEVWLRDHPLVFVEDLAELTLDDGDVHHLRRARRLPDGAPIAVGDGSGRWLPARLAPVAVPIGDTVEVPPRPWSVTVGFTPVKGTKPEWVIQKLTELGVDRIVPLHTDRSVVRWNDEREQRRRERWDRVVREAAMQARQLWLTEVEPMAVPAELLTWSGSALADPDGAEIGERDRVLLIGPEGGWSESERASRRVRLPGGILRAETAAVVGAAILVGHRDAQNRRG